MEDLNLSSDSDIRLELTTYDGTIESDDLCQLPSPYRRKLLKGEVHILGRSATLTVFEFIAGREVDFFSFKVQLEGGLLEVLHSESSLVPEGTRLFYNHYPWKLLGEVPPKDAPLNDLEPDICKEFRDRLMGSTPSAVPEEVPTPSANSH